MENGIDINENIDKNENSFNNINQNSNNIEIYKYRTV